MKRLLLVAFAVVLAIAFTPATAGEGMVNCPEEGQWGIAVWAGKDGANAEEALATCGVEIAYALEDGGFTSNISTLDNLDAVLALGSGDAVAIEPMVIYSRQHSDALPDGTNHASESLTIRIDRYGEADTTYGPNTPDEVMPGSGGDVEARFSFRQGLPLDRLIFYWDGVKFGEWYGPDRCVDYARSEMPDDCLTGKGFIYTVKVFVGYNQTYEIDVSVEDDGIQWVTRDNSFPPNPTCPCGRWVKPGNNEPIYCDCNPTGEFGVFYCGDPEYPGQLCSLDD